VLAKVEETGAKKTVLRIGNKSFGSGFGSGSGLKLVSDSDPDSNPGFPDPNLGFGSRPETGPKM
jgi:hypothetical protein